MSYEKTIWTDNITPLSAANFNKIEQRIFDIDSYAVKSIKGSYTGDGTSDRVIPLGFVPKFVCIHLYGTTSTNVFDYFYVVGYQGASMGSSGHWPSSDVAAGTNSMVLSANINSTGNSYNYVAFS